MELLFVAVASSLPYANRSGVNNPINIMLLHAHDGMTSGGTAVLMMVVVVLLTRWAMAWRSTPFMLKTNEAGLINKGSC